MTHHKRLLGIGIGLAACLSLAACTSNDDSQPPTQFRIITGEPAAQELQATITLLETQAASSPVATQVAFLPSSTPLADPLWQGMVINGDAVLFAEPQMDASEIGIIPRDTQVQVFDQTEPNRIGLIFYQIQYQNLIGWIASTQVIRADQASTTVGPSTNAAGRTPTRTLTPFPTATFTPTLTPTITATSLPPGFPTPEVYSLVLAEQVFERGRMLWLQPLRQIWVLVGDEIDPTAGTWQCYLDEFAEGQPERDPALDPPQGITTASRLEGAAPSQPIRGFGKIWRENAALREALGWAITPETLYTTRYEYLAGGQLQDGEYQAAEGQYHIESFYQYALVFGEESLRAPCETKRGTWRIE